MNLPLVTIRVNSYNHEKFVETAILSAINQTYSNTEVIVVDDGSTDDSDLIIKKLSKNFNFKYIRQQNKGLSATINDILINHTNGKYIIGTASDDILEPTVVEKYVKYMEGNTSIGMCFGNAYKINENSEIIGTIKGSDRKGFLLEDVALGRCKIPLMTFMWRVEIFKTIGYYDSTYDSEDIYMLYKVAKNFQIGYVDTFAKRYRVHSTNTSSDKWKMYINSKNALQMYSNEIFYPELVNRRHLQWFCSLSKDYKKEAFKYFPNAFRKFYSKLFIIGILNFLGFNINR